MQVFTPVSLRPSKSLRPLAANHPLLRFNRYNEQGTG
jgi:hypothetical protein